MTNANLRCIANMPEVVEMEAITPQYAIRDQCQEQNLPPRESGIQILWNLERISKRSYNNFNDRYKSPMAANSSTNVDLYIIDTGIDITHENFNGRVELGFDVTGEEGILSGHGTNVAGLAIARTYGVSKQSNAISVKALTGIGGIGSSRFTMDALQLVVDQIMSKDDGRQNVINMSLGGPKSKILNNFVNSIVTQFGVHIVVAAGNENRDACTRSPASAELAITVGASTSTDTRASFSNFGSCVDIFAPGQNILTIAPNGARIRGSGTSYSAPMVAGIIVNLLSSFPKTSPSQVARRLIEDSTVDVLSNIGPNSPNRLAFQNCSLLVINDKPTSEMPDSDDDEVRDPNNNPSIDDDDTETGNEENEEFSLDVTLTGVIVGVGSVAILSIVAVGVYWKRHYDAATKGKTISSSWSFTPRQLKDSMMASGSV
eukprot:CFRG3662T1